MSSTTCASVNLKKRNIANNLWNIFVNSAVYILKCRAMCQGKKLSSSFPHVPSSAVALMLTFRTGHFEDVGCRLTEIG
jgi:hypothetical protein